MLVSASNLKRRTFLGSAAMAAAGCLLTGSPLAEAQRPRKHVLFNGNNLDGWIQIENNQYSIGSGDITGFAALAKAIMDKSNAVAAYLNTALDDAVRSDLDSFVSSGMNEKSAKGALAKGLTTIIKGPSIYEKARFHGIALQPETEKLLHRKPHGLQLVELNRMLLVDAFPIGLASAKPGWIVKEENGSRVMASTGEGRGVIYTVHDYSRFRLMFTMRHVSGNPDHQACVLIFCTRPAPDEIPLDALGGIQFQVPKGGHWDYRPGHNNAGKGEFTEVTKVGFDIHQWSRVEIVADASTGKARMAVAQPLGSKAVEVLDFSDPTAGKSGPIALQMHNAGLFDEYKDLTIEENPTSMDLITTA
jgi:3-keto-disaccharide hydrolase